MIIQFKPYIEYLLYDFMGGPKTIQFRYIINTLKALTFLFGILSILYYENYSIGSILMLCFHGSYGQVWIFKDMVFGDKSWQVNVTKGSACIITFALLLYWSIDWIQFAGYGIDNPSILRIVTCSFLYIFGLMLMMVSDAQKFYTLQLRKGLIKDGMFKYCRNPNYLGEMMLYGSFAGLTGNSYCYAVLICVWGIYFNMNMQIKDISLSKKSGWDEYRKQSWLVVPKLFGESDSKNMIGYGLLIMIWIGIYQMN